MTAAETFLRDLSRRLWMSHALRQDRLEELSEHIARREAQRGHPFRDAREVASVMGEVQVLASALNREVPWSASRPALRLYLAIPACLALGALIYCPIAITLLRTCHPAFVLFATNLVMVMMFVIPGVVALYARHLCVRPLQAALPIIVPLIWVTLTTVHDLATPGPTWWATLRSGTTGELAMLLQVVVLMTRGLRPAQLTGRGPTWVQALPWVLPLAPLGLYGVVGALTVSTVPALTYPLSAATGSCTVLAIALVFHQLERRRSPLVDAAA